MLSKVDPATVIMQLLLLLEVAMMINGCCMTQHALRIMHSLTMHVTVYICAYTD